MKKNQYGFSALETLLVVIILAIIGFAGWYVWDSKQVADDAYKNDSNSQTVAKDTACKAGDTSQTCIEKAPAKLVKFSKLPEDLQKVALAQVSSDAPSCVQDGQLRGPNGQPMDPDIVYAPIGSAIIAIGCDSGSAGLFAKNKEGSWIFVEKTQADFSCDAIFDNPVPKKLLTLSAPKASCLDSAGKVQPYDTESSKRFI